MPTTLRNSLSNLMEVWPVNQIFTLELLEIFNSWLQALQSHGTTTDSKAEKQLMALLSIPLDSYDVVTVLSLKNYTNVMNLLAASVRKVDCCIYRDILIPISAMLSPIYLLLLQSFPLLPQATPISVGNFADQK